MEQFFDDVDDRPRDAAFVIGSALDDLQCADIDLNRYAARRAAQITDAVALARRNPEVYVLEGAPDAAEQAERAAVLDIALRLKRSEEDVQAELAVVQTAMRLLPTLWIHARDGFVSMYLVSRAVGALHRLRAPANATPEQQAAEREAARRVDEAASEWAFTCSPANFLRRLKRLADRLDPEPAEVRRTRAVVDRRVCVEHVDDGMSWFNAYIPTTEALAADRRLTATAKQIKKNDPSETRTIAQIRADLYSEWLRGVGTDRAAQTKVFVTIPVQLLDDGIDGDRDGEEDTLGVGGLPVPEAEIVGHGPIDPLTAKQLFLDTGVFRRVITDPIRSVIVDMDRRSRHATPAQRDWLVLQHGTCARDGCTRLALDADIDHRIPWAQGGRPTSKTSDPSAPDTTSTGTEPGRSTDRALTAPSKSPPPPDSAVRPRRRSLAPLSVSRVRPPSATSSHHRSEVDSEQSAPPH